MRNKLLPFVVCITLFTGCASLKDNQPAARLAVTYATLKVIEQGDDPVARSQKIIDIASDAKRFLGSESISVDLLEQAVRSRLAEETLAPSDRLLADALILTISAELKARVGAGLLSPEQRVQVDAVLDWVTVAAGG